VISIFCSPLPIYGEDCCINPYEGWGNGYGSGFGYGFKDGAGHGSGMSYGYFKGEELTHYNWGLLT
jgi:hypothetical protein